MATGQESRICRLKALLKRSSLRAVSVRRLVAIAAGLGAVAALGPASAAANTVTISGSMEGNITIQNGDFVAAGYSFTFAGLHPEIHVLMANASVRFHNRPKRANLSGPHGCVGFSSKVKVTGTNIARVVFTIDGKRVKTVRRAPFAFTLRSAKYGVGAHRLKAQVYFVAGGSKSQTKTLTFQRCARRKVSPKFTG